MNCEWECPDCERKCGTDFARPNDIELALTAGIVVDHEDFHQACDAVADDE